MLKKIVFLFLIGLSLDAKIKHLEQSASYSVPEEGAELLDKIEYVLYGPDETVVLTSSEINRLSIDGRALTPRQWLESWCTYLDAKRYKIEVKDEDVDKTLRMVQKEYGFSEEDLRQMFKAGGYTWQDARRQLGVMQVEKNRLDWEISSRSNEKISDKEIQEYCDQNPVYVEGNLTLQNAIIPFDDEIPKAVQREEILEKIKTMAVDDFNWSPAYTLVESELSSSVSFLKDMSSGFIAGPIKSNKGFELIKIVEKNEGYIKPFQERRAECEAALRQKNFSKIIDDYHDKIIEQTSIVSYE